MPFIIPNRRIELDAGGEWFEPGDLCYCYYVEMVHSWKANPRWTTAHNIYNKLVEEFDYLPSKDDRVAYRLAWEVFFQLYVMPYELKKREENGDIY